MSEREEILGPLPATHELMAALAKAQAEMDNAPMNSENPHFRSKYADLASIRNATIPALSKHGLSLHQVTRIDGSGMVLVTRLGHASGQFIDSVYPLPNSNKPHEMGSAITYARRYSWAAICGIAAEEDEDGNAANDAAKNGAKSLPALPARKSSAAAKRDGDWPALKAALADCQSAREVEKLRSEYRAEKYPAWNRDWQDVAEEEFEKRLAEFSTGEDLKQTLQDSLEEADPTVGQHTTYRDSVNWLQGAISSEDLTRRAKNAGYVTGIAQLTEGQRQKLRRVWADKAAELKGAII
jgi:hypothetical protein